VLGKLEEAAQDGQFIERFRIVRPGGEVRWVWARGFPVRDAEGKIRRLVGTVLEITAQKEAAEQGATNLTLARSSWAEAEALRKATFGQKEESWRTFDGHAHLGSWLSVPLVASGQYLGFLSLGHAEPNRFTQHHLRRAELLAIPAAAATQNSRLYERAAIYGEELEKRIEDLRRAQAALVQSEEGRHALSLPVFISFADSTSASTIRRVALKVWSSSSPRPVQK
jgi:GAF domain-containing protein